MKTLDRVHELFLNYACNAKCGFCYNPPITDELLRRELSFDQAAASLYSGAKDGAQALNIHGGEPTLRDDLPKLLRLAKKLGFSRITVVTNGVRLAQPGYARDLVEAGATHFRVSIHSADAARHDEILAIPGGFEKAVAGLAALKKTGASVGLNFVLHRANLSDLPAFLERFCAGPEGLDVIVYFPHLRGMMELNAKALGISYAEAAKAARAGAAVVREAGALDRLLFAHFVPCAAPELMPLMLDWAREGEGASMTRPEGSTGELAEMKDSQRAPIKACASCAVADRCRGVEREYLALRGEAGLTAL